MKTMLIIDTAIHWVAVLFYITSTILNVCGIIFRKEKLEKRSYIFVIIGLVIHGAVLLYRWYYAGHGPYYVKYEALSSSAWVILVLFLVFIRIFPKIRPASIMVFPFSFLLVALALFTNPAVQKLPPTLRSIWLVLHVMFYKIALGTLLVALAFSIFYILKKRRSEAGWLERMPDIDSMDLYAYRFAGFGFVFWAIATLAGAIWAYQSWGRFWGWDPIETWALITWVLFGIYLHQRRFYGWRGEKAAIFYIVCFMVALVAVFFVPQIESSVHSGYLR